MRLKGNPEQLNMVRSSPCGHAGLLCNRAGGEEQGTGKGEGPAEKPTKCPKQNRWSHVGDVVAAFRSRFTVGKHSLECPHIDATGYQYISLGEILSLGTGWWAAVYNIQNVKHVVVGGDGKKLYNMLSIYENLKTNEVRLRRRLTGSSTVLHS